MDISKARGERAINAYPLIIDPLLRMVENPEIAEIKSGKKGIKLAGLMLKAAISNRKEIVDIACAVDGITEEEYIGAEGIMTTLNNMAEILSWPLFNSLFLLAQAEEKRSSGSAPGNTEGEQV